MVAKNTTGDFPTISSTSTDSYVIGNVRDITSTGLTLTSNPSTWTSRKLTDCNPWITKDNCYGPVPDIQDLESILKVAEKDKEIIDLKEEVKRLRKQLKGAKEMPKRRIVKFLITDNDINLPLDKVVLTKTDEFVTDLEDKDIYFELDTFGIDIKDTLKQHNELRKTIVDKKASEGKDKDIYLDPIRIKDLNMLVITVANL